MVPRLYIKPWQKITMDPSSRMWRDIYPIPQAANGAGILEHVLGGQQPVVTQALAKGTGMQSDQIAQLLQIAAPLLLGLLGKQQKKAGFDPTDLSNYLGVQKQKTQKAAPDMMSTLNTLLDFER